MPGLVEAGLPVTVEGPYGCFNFEDQQASQIWVGGGIGITPFIARLDADKIRALVPGWKASSIWFCGPSRFGASLWQNFKSHGLPQAAFHRELFEMR